MKIEKNGMVLEVTKGAYEALFLDQGWRPYSGTEIPRVQNFMAPQPNPDRQKAEQRQEFSKTEIPFSEIMQPEQPSLNEMLENMTIKELTEYAHQNGVNVDGATKKGQIISIIRAAIEE